MQHVQKENIDLSSDVFQDRDSSLVFSIGVLLKHVTGYCDIQSNHTKHSSHYTKRTGSAKLNKQDCEYSIAISKKVLVEKCEWCNEVGWEIETTPSVY